MTRPIALIGADVWPLETPGERSEAVLVKAGRIAQVGTESAILRGIRSGGARIVDLEGATVLPGLIDSHTHLIHQGLLADRLDLWDTSSKKEALGRVRRALRSHRGRQPFLAERWDESRWKERAYPTRDELDALSRTVPVILRRVDGHIAAANQAACRVLKGKLKGVDEDRGLLVEEASLNLNRVFVTPPVEATRAALAAQGRALSLGLVGVHDFVVPGYVDAYRRLERSGRLRLRVRATPYQGLEVEAARRVPPGGRLELGGVKAFADGSIGGHTAALSRPYADEPGNRGRLNYSDRALRSLVTRAARAGRQPSIHAIGDAAISQVLSALDRIPARKRARVRPRIEHFEVHTDAHVEAAVEGGVVLSMQPNFVGEWSRPGGMYAARFGDARRYKNNEFRRLLGRGVRLAFGSDCMPLDPWWGLESCVRAPYADQRLKLEDALRAYTTGSAWGLGWERERGSLASGKRADLVVVRADWKRKDGIRDARVEATMIDGAWAWRRGKKNPSRP